MLNSTIALLGNPNSGKTTLFNYLTGRKQPVGNWSGVTVAQESGMGSVDAHVFEVIDLPGTYSLVVVEDDSLHDEAVPATFFKTQPYTFILNVADALTLERQLYLTLQALEQQLPVAIVINRLDLLIRQNKQLLLAKLESALGCPVMAVNTQQSNPKDHHKAWLSDLFAKRFWNASPSFALAYPAVIEQQLDILASIPALKGYSRWQLIHWLEGEKPYDENSVSHIDAAQAKIEALMGESSDVIIAKTRYDFIEQCLESALVTEISSSPKPVPKSLSDELDAVLCHRYWGLPCFLGIMYGLFFFAIGIGGEFQDLFESIAQFLFVDGVGKALTFLSAPSWMHILLVVGLGQGVTTIVTFIPVIGAMFFALSFLEECGYMARAAFVMDRLMRAVGLPGKSFVPMIVGFGCNVPAILGTRALDNRRDRILAVMMSPFMSCGARLAIFTVFVAAFFPHGGQNIVFILYVIGIAMAVLTGLLLKKTLLKGNNAPFLLEMPRYQCPQAQALLRTSWHRLRRFLGNAGKLIIPVCMVIGLLQQPQATPHSESILSAIGQQMVPVFKPMGIEEDNWPAAVGLLTGLMAKEVVIGTLNALYTPSDTLDERAAYGEMVKRFKGRTNAFAYLLFVLLYFPCMSATAAMLREVQKGWTLFSVCWTTGLAYGVAVGFYQCATFAAHPLQSLIWLGTLAFVGLGVWLGIRYYSKTYLWHKVPTRVVVN